MRQETVNRYRAVSLTLCLILFCCAAAHAVSTSTTELLNKFPGQSVEERDKLCAEVVKLGPDFVLDQVLSASSTPVFDAKVQFLLSGVANYVSRHGADIERKAYAGALTRALADPAKYLSASDESARNENAALLISLLQMAGGPECVEALSSYLRDERLCDPAARTLVTIGAPNAGEALAKALDSAAGPSRVAIVEALGELRWKPCAGTFEKDASSGDANLRRTALFALANIGDTSSRSILAKAAEVGAPNERAEATALYLRYARCLAETGKKKERESICRDLMRSRTAPGDANVRCAALSTLAEVEGKRAVTDLLAAIDTSDKELRGCALDLALKMPGKRFTGKWVGKMGAVDPERRVEILTMLAERGDQSALPSIVSALKDDDKAVRVAALDAATRLGGAKAFSGILASIESARDADETKAVKEALLRVVGAGQTKSLADKLPLVSPAAKKALLEILAARRAKGEVETVFTQTKDGDESVRIAALAALENVASEGDLARVVDLLLNAQTDGEKSAGQKTVVAVAKQIEEPERRAEVILARYATSAADKKVLLLPALSGVGGKRALGVVVGETRGSEAAVRDVAVHALAEWPDGTAIPELLALARATQDETNQVLALRGGVRLIGVSDIASADKVRLLKESMDLAKRPEERTLVLGTLADTRSIESLRMAAGYLDDQALQNEAALAAAKIACPHDDKDKGLVGAEVAEVLKKAVVLIADADMRKKVEAHQASILVPDAEGFVPLFNGKDLTGWTGDTKGYVAENGAIVCRPGGNLFTEGEYADFAFRFEFKLTPNANNGIGIRAPLDGNAAYAGMEIQVLDDSGSEYTKLQPYQYHGSIYGVVPCERGHQKPVGEWNSEEIIAQGPRIIVKLNGATIVDADIEKASAGGTLDHNAHPGLKNKTGHIGFLGHGSIVEFRNMRIKELK